MIMGQLDPVEEAIVRVHRMELLLDEITEGLKQSLKQSPDARDFLDSPYWQTKVKVLTAYYESDLWMQDYERDEAGEFPADLKRGVLSQDTVYDLLTELKELEDVT